jgi:hypothetical protein
MSLICLYAVAESQAVVQGIFQSTLIATVLGTHISSISAINPELRLSNKPGGALVLSIQAVSHSTC